MGFNSTLTAIIGTVTKLSHLNEVFQNTKWLKDRLQGDGAEGSGAAGYLFPPGTTGLQIETGDANLGQHTFTQAFNGIPEVVLTPNSLSGETTGISNIDTTGFWNNSQGDCKYIAIRNK